MYKWISKKRNQKGFTLIELIVVIAILGILAAIAIPRLGGFTDSAKEQADKSNASALKNGFALALANGDISTASVDTVITISGARAENSSDPVNITVDKVTVTGGTLTAADAFDIISDFMPDLELSSGKNIVITIGEDNGEITSELK